jgi:3-hydroxybutyryl-CoA dehydrogenase
MSAHVTEISTVTIIGAGFLGRQIAAMCAASGRNVRVLDQDPSAANDTQAFLRDYLAKPVAAGELTWDLAVVIDRISPVYSMEDAMTGTDLMIEAVPEVLKIKRGVFDAASRANPSAFLATNSSSIPSSALKDIVSQPDKLVNLHFFSEFWNRSMVELMSCGETSDETMLTMREFGTSLGLFCAVVEGQSKGFIINRVWRAVKQEVLKVVDEGHASPEDVDRLWAMFWGIKYGPFAMMDQVGLDVVSAIEDTYIAVSTDPEDRPSRVLSQHVDQAELGVKSGRGFYDYPDPAFAQDDWPRITSSDSRKR